MMTGLISKSSQLQILSLKYCPNVNEQTCEVISLNANSFFLREIYLDGCEKINDEALLKLTKPRAYILQPSKDVPKFLLKMCSDADSTRRILTSMMQSGTRGLKTISLAECRNITDVGIQALQKCVCLQKLCLLGCPNIKDEGAISLCLQLPYLEDLDLGSTNITNVTINEIVNICLNLRKVNLIGCKKLNSSDDLILKRHKINVESGEDVFRFHLIPCYNSDLPRITTSVLKTRSTLSLHKVYKYLVKKLSEIDPSLQNGIF
jgi:hypothetical protein